MKTIYKKLKQGSQRLRAKVKRHFDEQERSVTRRKRRIAASERALARPKPTV